MAVDAESSSGSLAYLPADLLSPTAHKHAGIRSLAAIAVCKHVQEMTDRKIGRYNRKPLFRACHTFHC
jgi:hypothetical protein